ncbi:hypothetical protein BH24CHL5_BH24CHL5_13550 [soil metagenome]
MSQPARAPIGLRPVALVAAAAVVFVLGLHVLSAFVPGLGAVFEYWPLLIVGLVVVTALVLFRALRPAGR